MNQSMDSGDKYLTSKIDITQTNTSLIETNSPNDNSSLHLLLSKLNIPINCLDNHQIRQHYLEEYSAKYSKAKHLLSNARKKQRKIIMTYYEQKEKEDDANELEIVKQTLLEENEKIKKFKEALKDKLLIYQQRIQFLKDAEFCSGLDNQQLQTNINTTESTETYTEKELNNIRISSSDLPIDNDSLHLLHDYEQIKSFDNLIDDSYPTISNDNKLNPSFDDAESSHLTEIFSIDRKQSYTQLICQIDQNIENSKDYFQWLKNLRHSFFILTSKHQIDRFKIVSTILMISLAIFLVIFFNDLLEYLLIYLTQPSIEMKRLSPSNSMSKSLFSYLLSTIYNCTTSWLLPFSRIFDYSI